MISPLRALVMILLLNTVPEVSPRLRPLGKVGRTSVCPDYICTDTVNLQPATTPEIPADVNPIAFRSYDMFMI